MFSGNNFIGYIGRMVRIAVLRDSDAIFEEGNEKVLSSEVILEDEVMYWNVLLSLE